MVLTQDGSRVGVLQVPEGLRIHQITRDAVVGVRFNSLGVESVHVHPLVRQGR
jgi:hypothetical protein